MIELPYTTSNKHLELLISKGDICQYKLKRGAQNS